MMKLKTAEGRGGQEPVKQFSVFTENKLGRLNELIALFSAHQLHVLALSTLDTSDSSILRLVVDDHEAARQILKEHSFPFTESDLLVIELGPEQQLQAALNALLLAELNIHYAYSFLTQPNGKPAVALNLQDHETATQALKQAQVTILYASDIRR